MSSDQIQAAGRAIDLIRRRHNGVCPPAAYVEAARPERSPIHDTLDWDPETALKRQLLQQASEIVRVVVRVDAGQPGPLASQCVFVNASVVTTLGQSEVRGTATPQAVVASADWRSQAERRLFRHIQGECASHAYLPLSRRILAFLARLESEAAEERAAAA